jgi:multidrug resistance efflux pump
VVEVVTDPFDTVREALEILRETREFDLAAMSRYTAALARLEARIAELERQLDWAQRQSDALRCPTCTCPFECGVTIAPACKLPKEFAEVRCEALTAALREIRMQATRKDRATNEWQYLVTDLEIIERRVNAALATSEQAPRTVSL